MLSHENCRRNFLDPLQALHRMAAVVSKTVAAHSRASCGFNFAHHENDSILTPINKN